MASRSKRLTISTLYIEPPERWPSGGSIKQGHTHPSQNKKFLQVIPRRYTPGARPGADTHARGGHTPHLAGYARDSVHSGRPRRPCAGLPPARGLLHAPAATIRKSARTG